MMQGLKKKGVRAIKSTSNSRCITIHSSTSNAGQASTTAKNLDQTAIRTLKDNNLAAEHFRQQNLTTNERLAEEARNDLHTLDNNCGNSGNTFADVLDGTAPTDISNAGEDMLRRCEDMEEEELWADLRASHSQLYGKQRDFRTRKDRTQRMVNMFQPQLQVIADAYMAWELCSSAEDMGMLAPPPEGAMVQGALPVIAVKRCT
ncbi:hypothetical protein B0H17DRAFT_1206846 [Mycena rosella]|uniref:Uncharacterized protein n=1 Tax=Mycena rosella TaxID=1033263 RepID=A0AAD7D4H1_MYCRO|nr:hypothetical protein B0H17DRAFT_1206846 [Mycena rosella]